MLVGSCLNFGSLKCVPIFLVPACELAYTSLLACTETTQSSKPVNLKLAGPPEALETSAVEGNSNTRVLYLLCNSFQICACWSLYSPTLTCFNMTTADCAYGDAAIGCLDALVNAPLCKLDSLEATDNLNQSGNSALVDTLTNRACPVCQHPPFLRIDHLKHHVM